MSNKIIDPLKDEESQRMHGTSRFRAAVRKVRIANSFKNTRLDQVREAMGDMIDCKTCEPFVRRILLKSPTLRARDTVETRSSLLGIGICAFLGYIFILVASMLSIHGLRRQEIASGEGILTTIQRPLNETLNSEDQAFMRSSAVMQIIDEKAAEVGLRKVLNAQQPCPLQIIEKDLHIIGTPLEPYTRFRDDCPGYFTSGWDMFGNLDEDLVRYLQTAHLSIGFILFGSLLEIFFGTLIFSRKQNDTEVLKTYWKLVGAVYPAAISMGAQMCIMKNAFGLLFVTLSLFKFGIPECYICFLTIAEEFSTYKLAKTKSEQFQSFVRVTLCYMVYMVTIVHHSVVIGWFSGCITGLIPFRRQTITPTLLLIVIHWVHLLRHVLPSIISSLLQIFVESIFISSVLKYLTAMSMISPYGAVLALCMVMAHVMLMFCEICYYFIETNNKRDKFYATVE